STRYRPYAHDANGSVVGLEGASGDVSCTETYDYDPYGAAVPVPGCQPSADAQDNPFRFQGFHVDSSSGSYDMHAREYEPGVGRFISPDVFESSLGDLTLQGDPLTNDRYAFAAGNPVNNIEFDGHFSGNEGGAQPIADYGKGNTPRARGEQRETPEQRAARHTTTTEAVTEAAEADTNARFLADPVDAVESSDAGGPTVTDQLETFLEHRAK